MFVQAFCFLYKMSLTADQFEKIMASRKKKIRAPIATPTPEPAKVHIAEVVATPEHEPSKVVVGKSGDNTSVYCLMLAGMASMCSTSAKVSSKEDATAAPVVTEITAAPVIATEAPSPQPPASPEPEKPEPSGDASGEDGKKDEAKEECGRARSTHWSTVLWFILAAAFVAFVFVLSVVFIGMQQPEMPERTYRKMFPAFHWLHADSKVCRDMPLKGLFLGLASHRRILLNNKVRLQLVRKNILLKGVLQGLHAKANAYTVLKNTVQEQARRILNLEMHAHSLTQQLNQTGWWNSNSRSNSSNTQDSRADSEITLQEIWYGTKSVGFKIGALMYRNAKLLVSQDFWIPVDYKPRDFESVVDELSFIY